MLDEGEQLLEGETEALRDGVRELLMESESVREYVRDTDGEVEVLRVPECVALIEREAVKLTEMVLITESVGESEKEVVKLCDSDDVELTDGELVDVGVPVSLRDGEFDALMEEDVVRLVDHDTDGELE
jgi:hypothetical protein